MARAISELGPKARAVYAASPELTAARAAQTAPPAKTAPPAPEPSSGGGGIPLPTASDIPGANAGEKALLVVGILVIGLGVFSRITGKPVNLGLTGFSGSAPAGRSIQPPATVSSAPLTSTMAARTAAVVPSKVGA